MVMQSNGPQKQVADNGTASKNVLILKTFIYCQGAFINDVILGRECFGIYGLFKLQRKELIK